ncbi:hypothetical protein GCM10027589_38410 [Actinocorallia lasiicapitis]
MGIHLHLYRAAESWLEEEFCNLPQSLAKLDDQVDAQLELGHGTWQMALELLNGEDTRADAAAGLVLGGQPAFTDPGGPPVLILLPQDLIEVTAYMNERRVNGYDQRTREKFEQGWQSEVLPSLREALDDLIAFYGAAAGAGEFVITNAS